MTNLTDPAFTAWLKDLPDKGFEADWVQRNVAYLRKVYDKRQGAPMQPSPPRPSKPVDRYEEI